MPQNQLQSQSLFDPLSQPSPADADFAQLLQSQPIQHRDTLARGFDEYMGEESNDNKEAEPVDLSEWFGK